MASGVGGERGSILIETRNRADRCTPARSGRGLDYTMLWYDPVTTSVPTVASGGARYPFENEDVDVGPRLNGRDARSL